MNDHQRIPIALLINNPSPNTQLGPLLRCAVAGGVRRVYLVGNGKCATQGSHGSHKHLQLIGVPTTEQAVEWVGEQVEDATSRVEKEVNGSSADTQSADGTPTPDTTINEKVVVIGLLGAVPDAYDTNGYPVVVDEETGRAVAVLAQSEPDSAASAPTTLGRSYPIYALPDDVLLDAHPRVCLLAINRDRRTPGLLADLAAQCHVFCHVPCVPLRDTSALQRPPALLDPPSCVAIALAHLAARFGYQEATFDGAKFHVDDKPLVQRKQCQSLSAAENDSSTSDNDSSDAAATATLLFANPHNNEAGDY